MKIPRMVRKEMDKVLVAFGIQNGKQKPVYLTHM